jgi:hypothetical protein
MNTNERPWDEEMFAMIRRVRPDDGEEMIRRIVEQRSECSVRAGLPPGRTISPAVLSYPLVKKI